MVADGFKNREIAAELGIGVHVEELPKRDLRQGWP